MKLSDINFGLFLEKHRFDVAVLTVLILSHHLGSRKLKNRPWRCFVGAHVNSCKSQRSPWDFTPVMNQRWYRSTMINLDCHKRETNTSKDRYIIWYTYHIYMICFSKTEHPSNSTSFKDPEQLMEKANEVRTAVDAPQPKLSYLVVMKLCKSQGDRACEVGKMGWDVRDLRRLSRWKRCQQWCN